LGDERVQQRAAHASASVVLDDEQVGYTSFEAREVQPAAELQDPNGDGLPATGGQERHDVGRAEECVEAGPQLLDAVGWRQRTPRSREPDGFGPGRAARAAKLPPGP